MKFIEKFSHFGRSGTLSEIPTKWRNIKFKTPLCLTYTCAGIVPHLTTDMLQKLDADENMFMVQPLPTIVEFKDSVQIQNNGLGSFIGLSEYPHHASVQDPAVKTPSGFNMKKGISVWAHGGKKLLTVKEFIDIQRVFQPFSYQALCDSDTPHDSSKKRLNKAVDYSINLLDQCLEEHAKHTELRDTAVFGTIEGGYDYNLRLKSAQKTAMRPVDGFVIDGFHLNGSEVKAINFKEIKPILLDIVQYLPSDKPRMMNGPFHPEAVLEAVKCGIDIFDSSYPYVLTNMGIALILPFIFDTCVVDSKKIKEPGLKYVFELDMNDFSLADDFEPLQKGCSCYCCKHFTRAYVHHLLVTAELLAYVLLMQHNMFCYHKFFQCIQKAIENQNFETLEQKCKLL